MQKSKGSLLARALKELSLVFSKNSSTLFSGNSDKSLFESCQVVADKMGFSLVSMAESLATIDQICRHSNIQHRKVNLKSHWWEKDHGHLIGYNKEKKQYIPLLRSNKSNYYTIDPISLKHIAIDACNAEEIADQACSIYHPLPKYCGRFIALLATVFKKNLREYRLIGIAGAVGIVLSFFIPLANKVFFDYVIPNYDFDVFYQVFLGLIVFTVTSAIFGFTRSIVLLRLNGVISNRLQLSLWDRLLKLPVSFFRSMPIGDLLQRTLIFEEIRDNLSQNTVKIIFNGVFSSIYLVIMFLYSWQLALAGVIIIFLSTCVTAVVFLMRLHYERIILRSSAIIHAFLIQATRGIVKIRIANVESTIFSIWAKKFSYNQSQRLKSQNLQNIVNTSTETFNLLTSLVIFAIVAFFQGESSQAFTVGQYLAFIAAFGPFSFATFEFLNTVTSLVSMIPLWERVQPILTVPVERKKGALDPGELKGAISIKNLDF
ncbi:MAG: hypothetical protein KAR79_02375, partial [Simkaniaceae bacterium]|nr:hypothetical protein [Simkaniaceae bacterium]